METSNALLTLTIGIGISGATEMIIESLGSKFKSYTSTALSTSRFEEVKVKFPMVSHKMVSRPFDTKKSSSDQGLEPQSYDLVVASNAIHFAEDIGLVLQNIRSLLKPGGYLVLLEVTEKDASRIGFMLGGLRGLTQSDANFGKLFLPLSTAQLHSILRKTGFSGIDTMSMSQESLAYPFSVLVAQAMDDRVAFLRQPLFAKPMVDEDLKDLIIIGTTTLGSATLSTEVCSMLSQRFDTTVIETIEEVTALPSELPTTVLVLTELCDPVFKDMTAAKLQAIKSLLRDDRNVVWVTRGCKAAEPYSNMMVGLGRSASNEHKELRLQFLDVDEGCDIKAEQLCELLLTLRVTQVWEREGIMEKILWTTEPELRMAGNHLLVPRIYQHEARNKRYNSKKRQITQELQTQTNKASIIYDVPSNAYRLVSDASTSCPSFGDRISIQVVCSLLLSLNLAGGRHLFPIVGRRIGTDEAVVALSTSNTSLVDIPKAYVIPLKVQPGKERYLLLRIACELLVQSILSKVHTGGAILALGFESRLLELLCFRASQKDITLYQITNDPLSKGPTSIFVHPMEFQKSLEAKIPSNISVLVDLSEDPAQDELHKRLVRSLPAFCEVLTAAKLFSKKASSGYDGIQPDSFESLIFDILIHTEFDFDTNGLDADIFAVPLKQVPTITSTDSFTIVDWTIETSAPVDIQPVDYGIQFSGDKTYLLVGLTGDLGQSLCEWFVQHGARYLALTSRKPNVSQRWLDAMRTAGANIKVCAM